MVSCFPVDLPCWYHENDGVSTFNDFGGSEWLLMFKPSLWLVRPAHKTRALTNHPEDLLQPLPINDHGHIALDFVSGHPPSDCITTVLTIVDRFSKSVQFVRLIKLPSAKESLVMNSVFRIHRLSLKIVSGRGPQFVSTFWKEFYRFL